MSFLRPTLCGENCTPLLRPSWSMWSADSLFLRIATGRDQRAMMLVPVPLHRFEMDLVSKDKSKRDPYRARVKGTGERTACLATEVQKQAIRRPYPRVANSTGHTLCCTNGILFADRQTRKHGLFIGCGSPIRNAQTVGYAALFPEHAKVRQQNRIRASRWGKQP